MGLALLDTRTWLDEEWCGHLSEGSEKMIKGSAPWSPSRPAVARELLCQPSQTPSPATGLRHEAGSCGGLSIGSRFQLFEREWFLPFWALSVKMNSDECVFALCLVWMRVERNGSMDLLGW